MQVLKSLSTLYDTPEQFFARDEKIANVVGSTLKKLHDFGKTLEPEAVGGFPELFLQDCDSEQIWQQLKQTTEAVLSKLEQEFTLDEEDSSTDIEEVVQGPQALPEWLEKRNEEQEREEKENEENLETSEFLEIETESSEHDGEKLSEMKIVDIKVPEITDERLEQEGLVIDEFEKFHKMMESGEMDGENSDEENDEDEEEEETPEWKQFVQAKQGKLTEKDLDEMLDKNKFKQQDEELEEFGKDLSNFEKRQTQIQAKISELEEKNLKGRGWQLMGEADAKTRPKDSLVDQDLEFDRNDKFKPEITIEKTEEIEDIIKQRIIDDMFDDVERKDPPKEIRKKKKLVQVESEKSKYGLAEIYEREFLDDAKEELGLQTEGQEKLSKEHREILELKTELFYQLDCLTNFHFTPRPSAADVQVNTEISAIEMEETLPTATAKPGVTQLAPEEIRKKNKKSLVGEDELSREEKKARHRDRKRKKRKRVAAQSEDAKLLAKHNEKLKRAMEAKNILDKLAPKEIQKFEEKNSANYGSSKTVFTLLQDRKDSALRPKKKRKIEKSNAHKFKG